MIQALRVVKEKVREKQEERDEAERRKDDVEKQYQILAGATIRHKNT